MTFRFYGIKYIAEFDNNEIISVSEIEDFDDYESVVIGSKEASNIIKKKYGITVDGDGLTDRGFINDPYFKIYSGNDPIHYEKITRISVCRP